MKATMILCDAAQEVGGKLYIIGGGWTNLNQPDTPSLMALAIILHFDWNEANRRHQIDIELQTDEGEVVEAAEAQPIRLSTQVEVGRPVGVKPGSEINAVLAPTFNGLMLPAGGYVWHLRRENDLLSRIPFTVGSRN
jgi:hypothetical protein